MDAYILGNLIGRLLMSALIVYLVLLIFGRFDFRQAARRMRRVSSVLAVIILFMVGLAMHSIRT